PPRADSGPRALRRHPPQAASLHPATPPQGLNPRIRASQIATGRQLPDRRGSGPDPTLCQGGPERLGRVRPAGADTGARMRQPLPRGGSGSSPHYDQSRLTRLRKLLRRILQVRSRGQQLGGQGLTCAPEGRIKQPAAQRLGDSTRGTNQRARAGSPLQQTGQPPPGVQGSYAPNPQPTSKLQHAQPDPVPSSPGTSTHDLELEASRALHRRGYPPRTHGPLSYQEEARPRGAS